MKSKVTSVRLKPVEIAKIKRIFGMNIGEFIRATLEIAENNPYIKNKIKGKGGDNGKN